MENNELHIKSGMKTPEGYFDSFQDDLLAELHWKNSSRKSSGFTVAKNYFENSESRILRATTQKSKHHLLRFVPYVAAVAVIAFLSIPFFINNNTGKPFSISDLNNTEIQTYLNGSSYGNDIFWLSEQIESDDIQDSNAFGIENQKLIEEYLTEYAYYADDNEY